MNFVRKPIVKVAVHNGIFHADDVLCVALLDIVTPANELKVYRTRDKNVLEKCDFILDVGCKDLVTRDQVWFDHHQEEVETDFYPNGIKKAACGKLFEFLWNNELFQLAYDLEDDQLFLDIIKTKILEKIFYPIEAQDNGQTIDGIENNKFSFVKSLLPPFNEQSTYEMYESFQNAVVIVENIFNNIIKNIIADAFGEMQVTYTLEEQTYGDILVLPEYFPWINPVMEWNTNVATRKEADIKKVVVFKSMDGNFMAQVVGTGNPDDKFESYVKFPESWAAKRDQELSDISGIPDAVFCHPGRFISGWKTLDSAIKAAEAITGNKWYNVKEEAVNE